MAKCGMCRAAKGIWPTVLGKLCDSCKGNLENCDDQREKRPTNKAVPVGEPMRRHR